MSSLPSHTSSHSSFDFTLQDLTSTRILGAVKRKHQPKATSRPRQTLTATLREGSDITVAPPSLVRDRSGFHPWKTMLGNVTPLSREATPMGVIVAKTFVQDVPQHIIRPRPPGHSKLPPPSSLA
jgi:hypothetical protein